MFTPRTLRAALVSLATLGALTLVPATAQAGTTWPVATQRDAATATDLGAFEDQLVVEINDARADQGLAPIRLHDSCVDRLASQWSKRIARTGQLEHRNQMQVIRKCRQSWAAEALVRGSQMTPESMVTAWLNSPGHRAIVLNRKAKRLGVAVATDSSGRTIGVLNVSRPMR